MTIIVLPNGREVDIAADDPQRAAAVARQIFQREHPQEYQAWAEQQPAGGFIERFSRGVDEMQGRLYGAAEAVGAATGVDMFERFGREGRQRNVLEAEEAMPEARLRSFGDADGIGGVLRAGQQAIAGSAPEMPLPLAGAIAGGAVGGIPGAFVGAALGAFPSFVGGNAQRQIEEEQRRTGTEPERIPAPGTAIAAAVPQAAVSGALDVLTLRLARVLGRPAEEVGTTLVPRILRGIGAGAVTEPPSEVVETIIERAQAGLPLLGSEAMREYGEAAAGAVFAGGAFGGVAGGAFGRRPSQTRDEPPPETPPPGEEFGPPRPQAPVEPPPVTDVEEARRIITDAQLNPPAGLTDEGLLALANDRQRATYRDALGEFRDGTVEQFLGADQISRRAGPPNPEDPAAAREVETDYTRGAPTLIRNVLNAQGEGLIEGDRFTLDQIAAIPLGAAGFESTALPTDVRTRLSNYLDGLVTAGYLEDAGKKGKKKSYRVALQPEAPRGSSTINDNVTQAEASAQTALDLIGQYQANPLPETRKGIDAIAKVVPDRNLREDLQEYLGLTDRVAVAEQRRRQLNTSANLTTEQIAELRAVEQDLSQNNVALASVVDRLEGRVRGTAIQLPGTAPEASTQVGRSLPATENLTGDEQTFREQAEGQAEIARGLRDYGNTLMAPILSNPDVRVDEAQIANRINEQPQEAVEFLQTLAVGHKQGTPFFPPTIQQLARAQGITLSPQSAMQLFMAGRTSGFLNRAGALAQDPRPTPPPRDGRPDFARAPQAPRTQVATPLDADVARVAAEREFRRVLGRNGQLELRDRIFLSEFGEAVQKAAAEAGITEVDGIAIADLAILAVKDRTTPITDVAIHEGFHVAENIGLFTPNEIAILEASTDKIRAVIRELMPRTAEADLSNPREVRAYGLNARVLQRADFGGLINTIFDKLTNFVDRLSNFVQGYGFQSWRDVYDAFYGGEFANRTPTRTDANVDFASNTNYDWLAGPNYKDYAQEKMVTAQRRAAEERAAGNIERAMRYDLRAQKWKDIRDGTINGGRPTTDLLTPEERKVYGLPPLFARAGTLNAATTRVQQTTKDDLTWPMRYFGSPIMTISKLVPSMRAVGAVAQRFYTRTNEMITEVESLLADTYKLPPQSVAKITRVWEQASRTRKAPNLTGLDAAERDALRQQMEATQKGLSFFIESAVISNFLPNANQAPAQRAKLEAFWQHNVDKHLWEIPDRELQAASPEGYREMQKLERLRNPYYMPMVGRGSHFIAAYKRKPNGTNGDLVAMVAYEPNSLMQRTFKHTNPETAAIAQLRAEFPDATKYNVMTEGRQFTNDNDASNLRDNGDFLAQYLERLRTDASMGGNTKILKTIQDMETQMDKAQVERIFRPNNNVLRAITPQNESSYILDVMPQYIMSMAKIQAQRYTQDSYKDATKALSPNDKAYWDNHRAYISNPTEAFGNLRAVAFFQYLGFAVDTALINATQNMHTLAMLTRDGGTEGSRIFGDIARKMGTATPNLKSLADPSGFVKNYITKHATPDERVAIERAMKQGIFAPVYTNESRSQFTIEGIRRAGFKNPQGAHRFLSNMTRWAGYPMQAVEAYNRATAFTAAYNLAVKNPSVLAKVNQIDGVNVQTPYDYAVLKVNDTQYLTTKEDRALFQRFIPAAEVATQFLSYPFKTIEQYAMAARQAIVGGAGGDKVLLKAGLTNLAMMIGPLVMLAGVFALPFADFGKDFLEDLIRLGWGTPVNFEIEMREMLGGGRMGEAAVNGAMGAFGIASLRRRLSLDPVPYDGLLSFASGTATTALFGPAGSMAQIPVNAHKYYQNGDYFAMAAAVMPRAVGNVIRGADVAITEDLRTMRGNRVITPETVESTGFGGPVPANISAGLRTAVGFQPPEFAREREIVGMAEELNQATRSRSERISKELAGILTEMMEHQRNNRMDEAAQAGVRYGARLRELTERELERPRHLQVMPQHSAIVRRAYRDFHGIGSEEAQQTTGRRNAREEVARQRALIDWRSQPN